MAEHALAMTLAAAKRLIVEHENLKRGQFNQSAGRGADAAEAEDSADAARERAVARKLMSCIGMRVHAINRRGRTDERVDWIGTPDRTSMNCSRQPTFC